MPLIMLKPYFAQDVLGGGKGYVGGGGGGYYNTTPVATIVSLDFANKTVTTSASSLTIASHTKVGINATDKGFFCGGITTVPIASINRMVFGTEVVTAIAATLVDGARAGGAGINSTTKGYVCGGHNQTAPQSLAVIDGLIFATEASTNPGAALVAARYATGSVGDTNKGYILAGYTQYQYTNTIQTSQGFNYSTESIFTPAASLAVGKGWPASFNSTTVGYLYAGSNASQVAVTSVDTFAFATETYGSASAAAAALWAGGSLNSTVAGYMVGGTASSLYPTNTTQELLFSNNTSTVLSATLAIAQENQAGIQGDAL